MSNEKKVVYTAEMMQTPTYRLFHQLFQCRVPYLQSRTRFEVEVLGIPVTGDDDFDQARMNDLIICYLPISKMYDYYTRGVDVYIMDERDTKTIYDIIIGHLEAWRKTVGMSLNVNNVPMDDLKGLGEFAGKIYKYAQRHYIKEQLEFTYIAKTLQESNTILPTNRIFKENVELRPDYKKGNTPFINQRKSRFSRSLDAERLAKTLTEEGVNEMDNGIHNDILKGFRQRKTYVEPDRSRQWQYENE